MTPKRQPPPVPVESRIEQAIATDPARNLTTLAALLDVDETVVWAVVDRLDAARWHRVTPKGHGK